MMIALIENEKKDTEGVKMYKNLEYKGSRFEPQLEDLTTCIFECLEMNFEGCLKFHRISRCTTLAKITKIIDRDFDPILEHIRVTDEVIDPTHQLSKISSYITVSNKLRYNLEASYAEIYKYLEFYSNFYNRYQMFLDDIEYLD